MATNLDHSTTSSQPDAIKEEPQTIPATTPLESDKVPAPKEAASQQQADCKPTHNDPKTVIRRPVPLSDEDAAVRSLDDTVMRPLPYHSTICADEIRRPQQEQRPTSKPRISTAVLVCVVAVVSFVAGGVVARLSSQVPVLFSQEAEKTHTQASYEQKVVEPVTESQSEPEQDLEATPNEQTHNPPSYDTGYDTVEETPNQSDPTADDTNTWQWNLDDEGNESISYDPYNNQVTIDYDGYSLSVPISDLVGDGNNGYSPTAPNGTDDYYAPNRTYGDGTGYDTEETRDRNVWGSPRSYSWS